MAAHPTQSVISMVGLARVTGPIFGNDLRVASRRKRSYALHAVYVALLTLFVVLMWNAVVSSYKAGALQRAQMAELAKYTTAMIVVPVAFCTTWLLVGTLVLLRSSMRLVHQVALRRAMGDPTFLTYLRRSDVESDSTENTMEDRCSRIRRVVGPPMIWKEMICALSRREKLAGALAIGIEVMMLFVAFTFAPIMQILGYGGTHLMYIWLFLALGVLFTISIPAAVICGERESRTWPLLLVTPLMDRDLLLGKFVGVLRRCGPVWLLLAYVASFALVKGFHPVAVVHVLLIMASTIVFLSATGFYFGSRCNRTTEAVTANLITAGVVWIVLPLVVQWAAGILKVHCRGGEAFVGVPFVQAYLLVATTLVGEERLVRGLDAQRSTLLMLEFLLVYLLTAGMFLWRAVRAFRRPIV